jgi:hypothetical protein
MLENIPNLRQSRNKASANRILNLYIQWAASHRVHLGKYPAIQDLLRAGDRLDATSLKYLVAFGAVNSDMELLRFMFSQLGKVDTALYYQALLQSFFGHNEEAMDYLLSHAAFRSLGDHDLLTLFVKTAGAAPLNRFQKLFQLNPGLIEWMGFQDWVAALFRTIRGYRVETFEFLFLNQKSQELSDYQLSFFLRTILYFKPEFSSQFLDIILSQDWAVAKINAKTLQDILHRCINVGNWKIFDHIIVSSTVLQELHSLEVSHIITGLARRYEIHRALQVMQKAESLGKLDQWAISEVFYTQGNDHDFRWSLTLFQKHPEWVELVYPNYLESVLKQAVTWQSREVVLEFLQHPAILNKINRKDLKRISSSSRKGIKDLGGRLYVHETNAHASKWRYLRTRVPLIKSLAS